MADSVRELILADIVTTMKLIDGTGSYINDVQDQVYRYAQTFASQAIIPSVEVGEPSEEYEILEGSPPRYDVRMTVPIISYVAGVGESTATKNLSQKISDMMQDIHRAMAIDETRGGNAIDTLIESTDTDVGEDNIPFGVITFTYVVTYRVSYTDPTDAC